MSFFLSSHFAKFVQPFFEVKVSNIPHLKSLLILKAGYMYSAVFYAVMHGILLYTLRIWFTDILANLDIQTELQD